MRLFSVANYDAHISIQTVKTVKTQTVRTVRTNGEIATLLEKRDSAVFLVSTVLRGHLGESGNSAQQRSIATDSYAFINWVLFLETCHIYAAARKSLFCNFVPDDGNLWLCRADGVGAASRGTRDATVYLANVCDRSLCHRRRAQHSVHVGNRCHLLGKSRSSSL